MVKTEFRDSNVMPRPDLCPKIHTFLLICSVFLGIELSVARQQTDKVVGSVRPSVSPAQTETRSLKVAFFQRARDQSSDIGTSETNLHGNGDTSGLEPTVFAVMRSKCQLPAKLSLTGMNCTSGKEMHKGLRTKVDAGVVFYRTVGGWITLGLLVIGVLFLFVTHFASISSFNKSGTLDQPFCSFPADVPQSV